MRLASGGRGEEESRDEYENRFHEKPPNVALERLALATHQRSLLMASPLQALVGRGGSYKFNRKKNARALTKRFSSAD